MNLTSRSRYALKIMLDLAGHRDELLVRRQDIVNRQGIPSKYLDQILIRLRREGLVESVRGRTGGYRIRQPYEKISLWEVFHAVEDGIYPVECVDEHQACKFQLACVASEPWQLIFSALRQTLASMTLAVFEEQLKQDNRMCPLGACVNVGRVVSLCDQGKRPKQRLMEDTYERTIEKTVQSAGL